MELDERKLRILRTIIDDYILTANPVGSRTISKRSDLGLSSATIRNEMSDLEEMGFLAQPHTSAGRVPSEKAYRFYVDSMMQGFALTEPEIVQIRKHFDRRLEESQEVFSAAASLLSEITSYASLVMEPQLKEVLIKHVQLVPVSKGRALAVIVTDAGIIRDAMIKVPQDCTSRDLEKYSQLLTARLAGTPMSKASLAIQTELSDGLREHRNFFDSVADAMETNLQKTKEAKVVLGGATNLLKLPEFADVTKASNLLSVLEAKERLYQLLARPSGMQFTITIGSENQIPGMENSSVVTATYSIAGKQTGSIGIIGPTRMAYSKVISVLGLIGDTLSEVLTDMYCSDEPIV